MQEKEKIQLRLTIRDILEHFGVHIASSSSALCPFHDDHHPSFFFKDYYARCYAASCPTQGTAFTPFSLLKKLLEQREGRGFSEQEVLAYVKQVWGADKIKIPPSYVSFQNTKTSSYTERSYTKHRTSFTPSLSPLFIKWAAELWGLPFNKDNYQNTNNSRRKTLLAIEKILKQYSTEDLLYMNNPSPLIEQILSLQLSEEDNILFTALSFFFKYKEQVEENFFFTPEMLNIDIIYTEKGEIEDIVFIVLDNEESVGTEVPFFSLLFPFTQGKVIRHRATPEISLTITPFMNYIVGDVYYALKAEGRKEDVYFVNVPLNTAILYKATAGMFDKVTYMELPTHYYDHTHPARQYVPVIDVLYSLLLDKYREYAYLPSQMKPASLSRQHYLKSFERFIQQQLDIIQPYTTKRKKRIKEILMSLFIQTHAAERTLLLINPFQQQRLLCIPALCSPLYQFPDVAPEKIYNFFLLLTYLPPYTHSMLVDELPATWKEVKQQIKPLVGHPYKKLPQDSHYKEKIAHLISYITA